MSYHDEMMNIPAIGLAAGTPIEARTTYKIGHRDARHAAAEIALKADARIELLERLLLQAYDDVENPVDSTKSRATLSMATRQEIKEALGIK